MANYILRREKYWKYTYQDWTQPVLTAAGTMGGDSFAVAQSSSYNSIDFWKVFKETSSQWHANSGLPQWVSWYNPKPMLVTKLYFPAHGSGQIKNFVIQACDDNSSWADILSYSNTNSTAAFEVDLSANETPYKYWRIYISSCYYSSGGKYYALIQAGFTITAQEKIVVKGTKEDHDFTTKGDVYRLYRKLAPVLQYTGDYTKTGSFGSINKGVASGFSSGNYLQIPETVPLATANTWEKVVKFTYQPSSAKQAFMSSNNSGTKESTLGVGTSGLLEFREGLDNSSFLFDMSGSTVLTAGNTYWVKGEFTGSEYNLYLSTNGVDYTLEGTRSKSNKVVSRVNYIGTTTIKNYEYVASSSIDLSQSYININGERWWSGDSYTKVGSWIDDNVVSGFSSSNYLQLPKTFNGSAGNTWEMVWKFRLNSDFTSARDHGILACSTTVAYASSIGVNGSTKVAYVSLATNTSGSKLVMLSATTTLEPETDYWVKVDFTGTAYNLYLSTNGTDYNLEASKESTSKWTSYTLSKIGYRNDNTVYPLKGSIDLTESYIKVDGEYWWRGAELITPVKDYVIRKKQYWKKIVTEITKYWKEIVTETKELAYACYRESNFGFIYYAKLPIGSDSNPYMSTSGSPVQVSSVSELKISGWTFSSLNESSCVISGSTLNRYTAGDLYETVQTTEVVEGTPDDYTYTEVEIIENVVPGTKHDYDFITE